MHHWGQDLEPPCTLTNAASTKSRQVQALDKFLIEQFGTEQHTAKIVHKVAKKVRPAMGHLLGVTKDTDQEKQIAGQTLEQIKVMLHPPNVYQKHTNDAMSLKKN